MFLIYFRLRTILILQCSLAIVRIVCVCFHLLLNFEAKLRLFAKKCNEDTAHLGGHDTAPLPITPSNKGRKNAIRTDSNICIHLIIFFKINNSAIDIILFYRSHTKWHHQSKYITSIQVLEAKINFFFFFLWLYLQSIRQFLNDIFLIRSSHKNLIQQQIQGKHLILLTTLWKQLFIGKDFFSKPKSKSA